MESEFWSVQCFPISERASLFLQVPRLSPLAFVIREVVRWSWVYDIGGFIPKRQNGNTGRKTCPITTFLAIELTWTGLGSNQGFHGGRPATKRFLIYFFPLCPCTFSVLVSLSWLSWIVSLSFLHSPQPEHTCCWQDSNPQSQQAKGPRPTLYSARQPGFEPGLPRWEVED
jgi:hypothetical protein